MSSQHFTIIRGGAPRDRSSPAPRYDSPMDRAARAMWVEIRADLRAAGRLPLPFIDEITRRRLDPFGRLEERCRTLIEAGYCHERLKVRLLGLFAAMVDDAHGRATRDTDRPSWRPAA